MLKNILVGPDLSFQKPVVIQFPVIDICNSKCQMCRIWENKKSNDISVEQLKKGLNNNLFSEVTSIGFNGGEPTLRDDLIELVKVVINSLPKLKHISLITNSFKYKQVTSQIDLMSEVIYKAGLNFDVMISLDGFEGVHDKVRGRSGNFENAKKVIHFVKENKKVNNIRIGCTVIKENVYHLAPLLEFCIQNDLYIKYRLGVPHQRLYTENLLDPYALTFEEKYELVEFIENLSKYYENNFQQRFFYRSLVDQIISQSPRKSGCDWQHRGATITAKGELAYCALHSKTLMPDISKGDPKAVYFGNESHLQKVKQTKCADCNHDYVGLLPKDVYRKQIFNKLFEKLKLKKVLKTVPGFSTLNGVRATHTFQQILNKNRTINSSYKVTPSNNKKVLICGWYGTETLGDKAIIAGIIYAFRKAYGINTEFYVASLHKYITQMTKKQMPEFKGVNVLTIPEALSAVSSMNFLVFGGGPIMGINDLAPMQVLFERAKENNVKTLISAAGVGPFGNKAQNKSIKSILELSDLRLYRDQRSKDYAEELGINVKNDCVVEDPAFTWLATQTNEKTSTQNIENKKVLLLGLRDFPYKEYARHIPLNQALAIKDNYENEIIKALYDLIKSEPNLIIKPVPMCTNHFGSDDRWFYRRLFRGHAELLAKIDDSLLEKELSPKAYYDEFTQANALLAMRFHSLVFGLGVGLNSVALDYTLGKGKVRSLAEKFNAPLICMNNFKSIEIVDAIKIALYTDNTTPLESNDLTFVQSFLDRIN